MKITLLLSSIAFLLSLTVHAQHNTAFTPEPTAEELLIHAISVKNRQLAPIKNELQLRQLLAEPNPLDALSSSGRAIFLESLAFGYDSLGSFNYQPLAEELSYQEQYQILALFGLQHLSPLVSGASSNLTNKLYSNEPTTTLSGLPGFAQDHVGYKCSGPGECIEHHGYICSPAHCK